MLKGGYMKTQKIIRLSLMTLAVIGTASCSSKSSNAQSDFLQKCQISFLQTDYCYKSTVLDSSLECNTFLFGRYGNVFDLNNIFCPDASSFNSHFSPALGNGKSVDAHGLCDGKSSVNEELVKNGLSIPSIHYIRKKESKVTPYHLDIDEQSLLKVIELIESFNKYGSDKGFDNNGGDYCYKVDLDKSSISLVRVDEGAKTEIITNVYYIHDETTDLFYPVSIECKKTYQNAKKGYPIIQYAVFEVASSDYYYEKGAIKKYIYDVDDFEFIYEGDEQIQIDETPSNYTINLSIEDYINSSGLI